MAGVGTHGELLTHVDLGEELGVTVRVEMLLLASPWLWCGQGQVVAVSSDSIWQTRVIHSVKTLLSNSPVTGISIQLTATIDGMKFRVSQWHIGNPFSKCTSHR